MAADNAGLLNPPRRFTTHPSEDKYPAVSPDGRWVAYSSMREGNWDIYLKSTAGGTPIRITDELTDEHSPCWSPKGDKIAFVSYKEDALGDVWVVKISFYGAPKARKAKKITTFLGYDGEPVFTADGKGIVFTSRRGGDYELWYKPLKKGQAAKITQGGGFSADISRDGRLIFVRISEETPSGEVFLMQSYDSSADPGQITFSNQVNASPVFSPDGKTIVLSRISRDTDNDGKITTDDNGSLMIIPLDTADSIYRKTFRITSDAYSDHIPSWGDDGNIYYSSSMESAVDIFSINALSQLGKEESAEKQLETAVYHQSDQEVFQLALESVIGFFPESYQAAEAIYLKGTVFADRKDYQTAANYFKRVMRDYSQYERLFTLAAIRNLQVITLYETESPGAVAIIANPAGFIVGIDRILSDAPHSEPFAIGSMLKANVLTRTGVYSEALEIYSAIVEDYPEYPALCAEAKLRSADILAKYGDPSEVVKAFLTILDDFPMEEAWNRLAIERIFALESGGGDISGLQGIIGKYRKYTPLTASARLNLAQKLVEMGETKIALSEYDLLRQIVSDNPLIETIRANAVFEAAEIYISKNEYVSAVDLLSNFSEGNDRFRPQTLDRLKQVYIERGNKVKSGDYQLARASFDQARQIDPYDLRAHRGYIESMVLMNKAGEVYREYSAKSAADSSNPVLLYSAGLALSYFGESDPVAIRRASALIESALDMDYEIIPAYLTLSYNYQAIEELQRSGKIKIGFLKRIYRGSAEIVSDFWRAVTFKSEPMEFTGYERAINVLTQAIVLNDEKVSPELEAKLLLNLGNNYYALGEFGFRSAYDAYQQMLKLDSTFANRLAEAVICEKTGRAALFIDEFPAGRKLLRRSENAYRGLGDDNSVFRLLLLQAELELRAGDRETSNEYFNFALRQAETVDINIPSELFFTDIAFNWHEMNEWNKARSACENALKEFGDAKITRPEKQKYKVGFELLGIELPFGIPIPVGGFAMGASRSSEGLAPADIKSLSLAILSAAQYEQGEYSQSAAVLAQKLKLADFKKYNDESSVCSNNLGFIAYHNGDYIRAASYFLQSLEKSEKTPSRKGYYVNVYNLMKITGFLKHDIELHSEAEKKCSEAVDFILFELSQPDRFVIHIPEKVNILGAAGEKTYREGLSLIENVDTDTVLTGYSKILRALDLWHAALKLNGNRPMDARKIMLDANIAAAECIFGSTEESLKKINNLVDACDRSNCRQLKWKLYYLQGVIEELGDAAGGGSESFEKSIAELEKLIPAKGRQSSAIEIQVRDLYQRLILKKSESGDPIAAFDLCERLSALKLVNSLAQRDFATRTERQKFVWSDGGGNVNYFRREIERLENELAKPELSDKKRSSFQKSLEDILVEYDQTMSQVREEDPEFASLFSVSPVTAIKLSGMLAENEAMIRFFELEAGYKFWIIAADDLLTGDIEIDPDELEKLNKLSFDDSYSAEEWKILSEKITQPLTDALEFYNDLLIIPDGQLEQLTFENLVWNGAELSKSHSVSYGHSAAYFHYARSKRIYTGGNLLVSGLGEDVLPPLDEYMVTQADSQDVDGFFNDLIRNDYAVIVADFSLDRFAEINGGFALHNTDSSTIKNHELFARDASLALMILHGVDVNSAGWRSLLRGLCFAGIGGIVTIPDQIKGEQLRNYLTVLLGELLYSSPLEAHRGALAVLGDYDIHNKNQMPVFWGDGGMKPDEAAAFAKQNFARMVRLGNLNLRDKNYDWAGRYYRQALEMAKGLNDRKSQFNLLKLLLQSANGMENWSEAVSLQKNLLAFKMDDMQMAEGKALLAGYLVRIDEIEGADEEIRQSVELFRSYGDDESAAQTLLNFGYAMESSGRFNHAVEYVDEARKIQVELGVPDTVGSDIYRGKLLLAAGDPAEGRRTLEPLSAPGSLSPESEYYVCQFLGRCCEKLMDYEQALEYFRRASLSAGESPSNMKANSVQGIADVHFKLGNYEESLRQLLIARNMFSQTGEAQEMYLSYNTEGLLNHNMGRLSAAETAMLKALELVQKSNDRLSEANIRQNLVRHFIETGRYKLALSQTRSKLEIDKAVAGKFEQAVDFLALAGIQTKLGDQPAAESAVRNAEMLNSELKLPGIDIRILILKLYLALNRGDLENSLRLSAVLDEKTESLGIPAFNWRTDLLQGILYEKSGDNRGALDKYNSAIEIIENMLIFRVDWLERTVMVDDLLEPYSRSVKLMIASGNFSGALKMAERARLSEMRRLVFSKGIRLRTGFEYDIDVRSSVAEITAYREKILSGGMKDGFENVHVMQTEHANLSENYFNIVSQVNSKDVKYYQIMSCAPSNIVELTENINHDQAVLYYFRTGAELFGWYIDADTVYARSLPIAYDELTGRIIAFRNLVEGILSIEESARELYSYLLKPFEMDLTEKSAMFVIAHGSLRELPFEALMDETGGYVIDRWSVSSAFNLGFLVGESIGGTQGELGITLISKPDYQLMPDLEFARKEVESISFTIPESRILDSPELDAGSAISSLETSDMVHFACHGVSGSDALLDYALLVGGSGSEGKITVRDIFSTRTDAVLVYLSACGKNSAGMKYFEPLNINTAFNLSGAENVIYGMWKADDLVSGITAKRFYRHLKNGYTVNQALREVKLYLKAEINPHPVYWAAFQLYGNYGAKIVFQ